MAKILKVTKPFFVMEIGDTFEYDANTKQYKSVYNIEHNGSDEKNTTVVSTYNSVYTISEEYAKMLIDNGYLEENHIDAKPEKSTQFVNIFDEIDKLISDYSEDLNGIDDEYKDMPECLKVEKVTVIKNLLKLLTYLKSLKK
nr:MAG TPA: hypothetical protein [Crassvirales sp.]